MGGAQCGDRYNEVSLYITKWLITQSNLNFKMHFHDLRQNTYMYLSSPYTSMETIRYYKWCYTSWIVILMMCMQVQAYYSLSGDYDHEVTIDNSILVLWYVQILYTNYKYYKWNRHLSLKYHSELKYLSDFVHVCY